MENLLYIRMTEWETNLSPPMVFPNTQLLLLTHPTISRSSWCASSSYPYKQITPLSFSQGGNLCLLGYLFIFFSSITAEHYTKNKTTKPKIRYTIFSLILIAITTWFTRSFNLWKMKSQLSKPWYS